VALDYQIQLLESQLFTLAEEVAVQVADPQPQEGMAEEVTAVSQVQQTVFLELIV
jgi:hypothetical protein